MTYHTSPSQYPLSQYASSSTMPTRPYLGMSHVQESRAYPEPYARTTTSTKRPKYTRSKTGCLTCRVKKVKCDEVRPTCTRCELGGRDCTWPPNSASGKGDKKTPTRSSKSSPVMSEPDSYAVRDSSPGSSTRSLREHTRALSGPVNGSRSRTYSIATSTESEPTYQLTLTPPRDTDTMPHRPISPNAYLHNNTTDFCNPSNSHSTAVTAPGYHYDYSRSLSMCSTSHHVAAGTTHDHASYYSHQNPNNVYPTSPPLSLRTTSSGIHQDDAAGIWQSNGSAMGVGVGPTNYYQQDLRPRHGEYNSTLMLANDAVTSYGHRRH